MIAIVQGELLEQGQEHILLNTGGIGWRILVPLRTLAEIGPVGAQICLRTHLEVRAESWTLFGFETAAEVEFFHLLTSVNGVGPKMGLAILSVHDVPQIARAIVEEDLKMFTRVPGIGKKTAQRLLLELSEKARPYIIGSAAASPVLSPGKAAQTAPAGPFEEVRQALAALGFQGKEIEAAAESAIAELGDGADTSALLKSALAHFRQG